MDCLLAALAWHETLVDGTVDCGIVVVAAGVLACMVRLFRGPHLVDRAIALDTLAVHVVAFVILLTLRLDSLVLFDGAMVLSLVGFAGTVAVSQYIVRPHLRRRADAPRHVESREDRTQD